MPDTCYRHEHILHQQVPAGNDREPNFCDECADMPWFKVSGKYPNAEFYTWTFYKAKDAEEAKQFAKASGWRDVRVTELPAETRSMIATVGAERAD